MLRVTSKYVALKLSLGLALYTGQAISSANAEAIKTPEFSSNKILRVKSRLLEKLYEQLKLARDIQKAHAIERAIEKIWLKSGSNTVDLLMARVSLLQHKPKICLKILSEVITIAPGYTEAWNRRATLHYRSKKYSLALLDIRSVLALDHYNFHAINGLGQILQDLGDKPAALKVYKKLQKIHPYFEDINKTVERLEQEVEGQNT